MATFRILFVLVVLSHDRSRLVHFNVTDAGVELPGSGHSATLTLAKRVCRARNWINPTGMP